MNKPTQLQITLSHNINRYRLRNGFTQAKLAEMAGISTGYMNDIEKRQRWANAKIIEKIAAALNVVVYRLFEPHEDETESPVKNVVATVKEKVTTKSEEIENEVLGEMLRRLITFKIDDILDINKMANEPLVDLDSPSEGSPNKELIEKKQKSLRQLWEEREKKVVIALHNLGESDKQIAKTFEIPVKRVKMIIMENEK